MKTYDPLNRPTRRCRLGEGVHLVPEGRTLRFVSVWANDDEREACRCTVPSVDLAPMPPRQGLRKLQAEVELGDGLVATVEQWPDRYVWRLSAIWANDDRKALYEIESVFPPYA